MNKILFFCLMVSVMGDCSCNTTYINNNASCSCVDIESYQICRQSYYTVLNYTDILSGLVRPYLDDFYYIHYINNLKYSLSGFYCNSISTCIIEEDSYSCKNRYLYDECKLMQSISNTINKKSIDLIFDRTIRNMIIKKTSIVNINIDCDDINKNYVSIKNNSTNNSNKIKINKFMIYFLLICVLINF